MKILMVCLGNICRSPLAEGILQTMSDRQNLGWKVDSAGTSGWHAGEPPHIRSIHTARKNGVDITHQKSRQFRLSDFDEFDHILVMDAQNYQDVTRLAPSDEARAKVELIMNFAYPGQNRAVPDPYNGDIDGYEKVFSMLEMACEKFISQTT